MKQYENLIGAGAHGTRRKEMMNAECGMMNASPVEI